MSAQPVTVPNSLILSNPGSVYNGHARVDIDHLSPTNRSSASMPVLKLPPSVASCRRNANNESHNSTTIDPEHQPAEFTLAKFTPDKNVSKPASRHSTTSGPRYSPASVSQRSITSASQAPSPNGSIPSKQRVPFDSSSSSLEAILVLFLRFPYRAPNQLIVT